MFCPACQGEYRPGITRCPTCDEDLVPDLSLAHRGRAGPGAKGAPAEGEPLLTYCGFLALDEARHARDLLRREGIRSEIAIREAPESDLRASVGEEYWLRISPRAFEAASAILGYDEAGGAEEEEGLCCSACGQPVSTEETFCPRCGERFSDG